MLITINFVIQMLIDALSARFVDKIGYRASALLAHTCAIVGLGLLTILPEILPNVFSGILISLSSMPSAAVSLKSLSAQFRRHAQQIIKRQP